MRRYLACTCVLALLPALAGADEVFLKGGGKVSGRILSRTVASVEVDVGAGTVTLPMSSVVRIEERRSPLDEYHERAAALGHDDRDGWLALARWASSRGLGTQARRAYEKVVAIDPANAEANQGLGKVELDGRWVTRDESYAARGYVQFEGEWMMPAEQEAILRERAAADEAERARLEAEQRAREEEAAAHAAAAESGMLVTPTIPVWWNGWGPAPPRWPAHPIARPPSRPGGRPPAPARPSRPPGDVHEPGAGTEHGR